VSARAVAGGSAVGFAAGWNIADTGAVAEQLSDAYDVGLGVIGLFTGILFLVHMLMQLPAGRLSDRLGAAQVCAAGLAVMMLANALASIAPELWLGLASRALMGVGTALGFIAGSDFVRATGGSPFAQGLYGGLATAGGGVALAVVPLLEVELGWRAPFVSATAVAGIAAGFLLAAPKPAGLVHAVRDRIPLRSLTRDRRLVRLAVVFAASFGLSVVIGNWVVTLLERQTSVSHAVAGATGASTLVLGVVSRPFGGWILQRHPARASAAVAAAALAGAAGTVALAAHSVPVAAAGACVVGLAAGISFAYAFTGAARLVPNAPATAIGLVNSAGALTVVVGSALVGVAFAAGAGAWAFGAMAALWAASALAAWERQPSRVSGAQRSRSG
jgi:MFS family permease